MVFVDLSAGPATERHLGLELVCDRSIDRDLRDPETEVFAQSLWAGLVRYFPLGYKWRMRRESSFSTWDPQVQLGTHGVAIK